jgi:hypothetical protein
VRQPAPRVLAVLVLTTCVLSARSASAADATMADVEKLIKKGGDLRRQGQDQAALPLYQKAYELAATPRTAAQLALCEMQLGYYLAAESHFTEALAGRSDWLNKNRAVIEQALENTQKQVGDLVVSGSPSGAEVIVNGKSAGTLPLDTVRIVAGQVKVEVRSPGYSDSSETVMVKGHSRERITVHLRREGTVEPPRVSAETGAPATAAHLDQPRPPVKDDSAPTSWGPGRIAGTALVGVSVLAVAGGVTLIVLDKRQSCERQMAGDQCAERTRTAVPGWVLVGGGVAAGIAGGVLLYSSSTTQVALSAGPVSVAITGRF